MFLYHWSWTFGKRHIPEQPLSCALGLKSLLLQNNVMFDLCACAINVTLTTTFIFLECWRRQEMLQTCDNPCLPLLFCFPHKNNKPDNLSCLSLLRGRNKTELSLRTCQDSRINLSRPHVVQVKKNQYQSIHSTFRRDHHLTVTASPLEIENSPTI